MTKRNEGRPIKFLPINQNMWRRLRDTSFIQSLINDGPTYKILKLIQQINLLQIEKMVQFFAVILPTQSWVWHWQPLPPKVKTYLTFLFNRNKLEKRDFGRCLEYENLTTKRKKVIESFSENYKITLITWIMLKLVNQMSIVVILT